MEQTTQECMRRGVGIGVHPSFPDLVGFGRRHMTVTPDELRTDVLYQMGALHAFATASGGRLQHLTPHGVLANVLLRDAALAQAVVAAVQAFDPSIVMLVQDGELTTAAAAAGLQVGYIGIVDRGYHADGSLVPRGQPGDLIHDEDEVAERTVRLVTEGVIRAVTGE